MEDLIHFEAAKANSNIAVRRRGEVKVVEARGIVQREGLSPYIGIVLLESEYTRIV